MLARLRDSLQAPGQAHPPEAELRPLGHFLLKHYRNYAVTLHLSVDSTDQLDVIAKRLAQMGVASLKEATKHQAAALVLMCRCDLGKPEPTPQALHEWLNDFQSLHKAATTGVVVGNSVCSQRPSDMGTDWRHATCMQACPTGAIP